MHHNNGVHSTREYDNNILTGKFNETLSASRAKSASGTHLKFVFCRKDLSYQRDSMLF
jgi:hypothetical protein